jgi:hypothetical protein
MIGIRLSLADPALGERQHDAHDATHTRAAQHTLAGAKDQDEKCVECGIDGA